MSSANGDYHRHVCGGGGPSGGDRVGGSGSARRKSRSSFPTARRSSCRCCGPVFRVPLPPGEGGVRGSKMDEPFSCRKAGVAAGANSGTARLAPAATPAATAAVRKDAGDDPDVTDGLEVVATVSWNDGSEVTFSAGEGVGTVTKPGLQVPPGQPAINPVPRRMIVAAVRQVTPAGCTSRSPSPAAGRSPPGPSIRGWASPTGCRSWARRGSCGLTARGPCTTPCVRRGRGRRVRRNGPRVGPRGDRLPRGPGEVRPRRSAAHRGRQRLGLRAGPVAASPLAGIAVGGPPGQTGQAGGRPVGHAFVAVRSGHGTCWPTLRGNVVGTRRVPLRTAHGVCLLRLACPAVPRARQPKGSSPRWTTASGMNWAPHLPRGFGRRSPIASAVHCRWPCCWWTCRARPSDATEICHHGSEPARRSRSSAAVRERPST